MEKLKIEECKIVLKDRTITGDLEVENGIIQRIKERAIKDEKKAKIVSPGVIDLHTHGSGGYDFMDGTKEDIKNAALSLMKYGVTTALPTTLTSTDEELFQFLDNFNSLDKSGLPNLEGVHLEGPYFSYEERGAQNPLYLKNPTREHYKRILERASGSIKRWTVAPELDGAMEMFENLNGRGILLSAGHTTADYKTIREAVERGVKLLTHFYSGMSLLKRVEGFRVLGTVEAGYLLDDLSIECIADGKHLPSELLALIFKCKDNKSIISCSDSMRGAGEKDGKSILGPKSNGTECIIEDGIAKMPDRKCFAGSVATGETIIDTLVNIVGLSLNEAFKICSLNPATLIGIDDITGSIEVGKRADLIILDPILKVEKVIVSGVERYKRS